MNEEDIFHEALARNPADRAAYLSGACAGHPALRAAVDALLRADVGASGFLSGPAVDATVDRPTATEGPGTAIGSYKLLEQIGEGGFGVVYLAEQTQPVRRKVALKVLKPGMDTRQVVARFEGERQALAVMDHPNIARVFDGGGTASGRPYFVMELVKGVPITEFCDQNRNTTRDRLGLFVSVCQAVQHAHQKGIVHRDIKPSNVLVSRHDTTPVVKVIDFGVAKALGQALTDKTLFTGVAQMIGTPLYMSPEQAGMSDLDVDTRSDVYSLGVLLYELLTGTTPFPRERFKQASYDEIRRIIREEEPPRPSTRLTTLGQAAETVSADRGSDARQLGRAIRGDLDWIVMKALEKDRGRRYETASDFALDVQRYSADEAVQACPPSAGYRFRKFARRNRAAVLTAAVILFVLVAGVSGTTFGLIRAEHRRADAEEARTDEAAQRRIADEQRRKAEQAEADTLRDYRASTDDAIEQLIGSKPDLGPQEKIYLEKTLKRWQAFAARQGDDERSRAIRAEGHHHVGLLWHKLGRRDEARAEYETARDLFEELALASPADPQYQLELVRIHGNLGNLLSDLGQRDAARTEYEATRDLQQKLVAAFPAVPEFQKNLASTHNNLGVLLADLGHRAAARAEYETARDTRKKLAAAFPAVPQYQLELAGTHTNLGNLLKDLGQPDAARTEYKTACDRYMTLVAAFPAVPQYQLELARPHNNVGLLLHELGQPDAARTEYETALDQQKKLVAAFPAVPRYQQELARTHNNLGNLLAATGQRDAARTEYETALDQQKKLAAAFPAVPQYRQELAGTHNSRGILLHESGQRPAARGEYEAAIGLFKKLAAAFPAVPQYQLELARLHNNLGLLLHDSGERDAARTEYETAFDLRKKLVAAFPAVPEYQVDLGGSYLNFGNLLRDGGQQAESLHWLGLAIGSLTPVYEKDRGQGTAKLFLRNSHLSRAWAYDQLKKHAEAVTDWDRAVELSSGPEQPTVRAGRAVSRLRAGQTAEAVAEVAELTKASKWAARQWYDFACAYAVASTKIADQKQAYADRAVELLRQAVKAGYKDAAHVAKDPDLDPLREREDFQKLLAELQAGKK